MWADLVHRVNPVTHTAIVFAAILASSVKADTNDAYQFSVRRADPPPTGYSAILPSTRWKPERSPGIGWVGKRPIGLGPTENDLTGVVDPLSALAQMEPRTRDGVGTKFCATPRSGFVLSPTASWSVTISGITSTKLRSGANVDSQLLVSAFGPIQTKNRKGRFLERFSVPISEALKDSTPFHRSNVTLPRLPEDTGYVCVRSAGVRFAVHQVVFRDSDPNPSPTGTAAPGTPPVSTSPTSPPASTATARPAATSTITPTVIAAPTSTPLPPNTPTATRTPIGQATATRTPTVTATRTPTPQTTATATPVPSGSIPVTQLPFITAARLNQLRAAADQNTTKYQEFMTYVATAMSRNNPDDDTTLLACAYAVNSVKSPTAAAQYGARARQYLMAMVGTDLLNSGYGRGYDHRGMAGLVLAATCLDGYSNFTATDKTNVATWLVREARKAWPELDGLCEIVVGACAEDKGFNNFFSGHWSAGATAATYALALGVNTTSARQLLNVVQQRFNTDMVPFMLGTRTGTHQPSGVGGVNPEGVAYATPSHMALGYGIDAIFTASGGQADLMGSIPFARDSLLWRVYATMPTFDRELAYGELARDAWGSIWSQTHAWAILQLGIPSVANDPQIKGITKNWLRRTRVETEQARAGIAAEDFIYSTLFLDSAAEIDITTLPKTYFAPGQGMFVSAANWNDPNTVYWTSWSGSLSGGGHREANSGGLQIFAGGEYIVGARQGNYKETDGRSNITYGNTPPNSVYPPGSVQNYGQQFGSGGRVLSLDVNPSYVRILSDQTNAYGLVYQASVVTQDLRQIIAVNDRYFIYNYDGVVSTASQPSDMRLWGTSGAITVSGQSFSWSNGARKLFGSSLGTAATMSTGSAEGNNFVMLRKSGTNSRSIMAVLEIAPTSQTAPTPRSLITIVAGSSSGMQGVEIGSDVAVLFPKLGTLTDPNLPIQYRTSTRQQQNIITGLVPNRSYAFELRDAASQLVSTTSLTANAKGSLTFSPPSGVVDVSFVAQ